MGSGSIYGGEEIVRFLGRERALLDYPELFEVRSY
jgi:hypothetical protein